MTDTVTADPVPPATPDATPSGTRRPARWRRWARHHVVAVVVLGVVGSGLAVAGGLHVTTGRNAAQVGARWQLDCAPGTEVTPRGAVVVEEGWRCDVLLEVVNRGGGPVELARVVGPSLGPGGGAVLQGLPGPDTRFVAAPTLLATGRTVDSLDAVYEVEETLEPGERRLVTLPIGWRPEGCNSAGRMWFGAWPRVVVRTWGIEREVPTRQRLRLRLTDNAATAPGCRG